MLSDYALHAVKGIKKSFDNAAQASILEYKDSRLFMFEDTTEWTEIFNSTEALSGSKELSEAETPPTTTLDEGYQVSLTTKRFGGAIELTEDDLLKAGDSTTLIDKYIERKRNQLLVDNRNLFLTRIFTMYNEAFDSTSDYLAPDGVELCGTHSWSSGGSTWSNASTTAMSETALEELETYGGAFTDAKGRPMPITFDTIVVKKGSTTAKAARKLAGVWGMVPAKVADINIYEGEYTIIETPYITSTNKLYWFALSSRMENPLYVGIRKMPSMNEPIRQNNESIRSNATGYWKQGINNMPIAVYGSTGVGSGS